MDQFPAARGNGLPGGFAQAPRIVIRPELPSVLIKDGFRQRRKASADQSTFARGRRKLRAAHLAWFAVVVLVISPLNRLHQLGGVTADAVFAGAVALLVGLLTLVWKSMRLEWDGQQLVRRAVGMRTVVATQGEGQVVRATLKGSFTTGATQYWLDAKGKARGQFPERQWDAQQLARIAAEAHLPVVDVGEITMRELAARYPEVMPKALAALAPSEPLDSKAFDLGNRKVNGPILAMVVVAFGLAVMKVLAEHHQL